LNYPAKEPVLGVVPDTVQVMMTGITKPEAMLAKEICCSMRWMMKKSLIGSL
jgi:hypothetical protein